MSQTKEDGADNAVLEQNLSTLLEAGGEAPRMPDAARERIKQALLAKYGKDDVTVAKAVKAAKAAEAEAKAKAAPPAKSGSRAPLVGAGGGLAAAAAVAAFVVARGGGGGIPLDAPFRALPYPGMGILPDGSSWVAKDGAKVDKLGPRHVRVHGAALLDVVPGKGPFTVDTDHGTIEVLGTRFLVDAEADTTAAAVVRGEVKLVNGGGDIVLHAGEQAVATHREVPVRVPAPRLSHLVSWAAQARSRLERINEPIHHGTLFAKDPGVRSHPPWGNEYPLPMANLKVDVVVDNQVARVALDQTFHNDQPQDLEGTYRFAIPPDASLQRLAMYVDGKLEESAVVERMAARRIYEELVYRRVDPALLEWSGTGRLNLRVYPIPAQQDKRLVLAYTESLPKLYDDYSLAIPMPEIDAPVGEVSFDVRVKGCAKACEVTSTSHQLTSKPDGDDMVVSYHNKGEKLGDSLVLHVRDPRKQATVASAGSGSERYLMVRAPSDLPALTSGATAVGGVATYAPKSWVILDDVSASRSPMELRAQAEMTDAFLNELDENDRVSIVAFDVTSRTVLPPTRVLDVDRNTVRIALAKEGGVGATDFAAALTAAMGQLGGVAPDAANVVYLGDGVITSGTRKLDELRAQIAGKAHFIGVGVGDGPDTQTLESLAGATGGFATTIDLADDVDWRTFDLVAALHTARATGVSARLVDAKGDLVPGTTYLKSPQLADGEELELVTKLAGDGVPAAVELTGERDGKSWTQRIELASARPAGDAAYLPRLWAQRHIAARLLAKHEPVVVPPCPAGARASACPTEGEAREARDEQIRHEVIDLGKKYFLLSRHTSLLVLENDEMYKKFGVVKGAGDTWAPYALPATIPVVKPTPGQIAASSQVIDIDSEVVRAPLSLFGDYGVSNGRFRGGLQEQQVWFGARMAPIVTATPMGGVVTDASEQTVTRHAMIDAAADSGVLADMKKTGKEDAMGDLVAADESGGAREHDRQQVLEGLTGASKGGGDAPMAEKAEAAKGPRVAVTLDEGEIGAGSYGIGGGRRGGYRATIAGELDGKYGWLGQQGQWAQMYLRHLASPQDPTFDDLTAFVPALVRDDFDAWRAAIAMPPSGGAAAAANSIAPAAQQQLARARAALASGVYRWGDYEIALDAQRRVGWHRTTDTGLEEVSAFDGATWTRRYPELGLEVTRALGDDGAAFALAYLPVLIGDPAQLAKAFVVTSTGPHQVSLTAPGAAAKVVGGATAAAAFVVDFDARDRLVKISDGGGHELVSVTWDDRGPTGARIAGRAVAVSFAAQAISDAVAWAEGATPAQAVAIELPIRTVARATQLAQLQAVGSAAWRHAQRQRMAAMTAVGDRAGLGKAYAELAQNGGVETGDLALAAAGMPTLDDATFATALAPFATAAGQGAGVAGAAGAGGPAGMPPSVGAGVGAAGAGGPAGMPPSAGGVNRGMSSLARYVFAARAFQKDRRAADFAHAADRGLVAQLLTLREATAFLAIGSPSLASAQAALAKLDGAATQLRIAAAYVMQMYDYQGVDGGKDFGARAWDAAAVGPFTNIARQNAARALFAHGQYDAGADRVAALVANLDLNAAPPHLDQMVYQFQQTRRGMAGWQIVWSQLKAKVLASESFDHVVALLGPASATGDAGEIQTILGRAAAIAGDDTERRVELAQLAMARGQGAWAQQMLEPIVVKHPTRPLEQLLAQLALQQGRNAEALVALEAAQVLADDEAVDVNQVRTELGTLIEVAKRVAIGATGATRDEAVQKALAWGAKWRAIDAGNPAIDEQLGDVLLAVGDTAGAWRQLSTVIERAPMEGQGYMTVAEVFERQGRVADALDFWERAIVIDQTNPTPRLRKAQALIALGRGAEGDAILDEINRRTWHDVWSGVVYQARNLRDRGRARPGE